MKRELNLLVAMTVAVTLGGCAGASGPGTEAPQPIGEQPKYDWRVECAGLNGTAWLSCLRYQDARNAWYELNRQITFQNWSQLDGLETLNARGVEDSYYEFGPYFVDAEYSGVRPLELSLRYYGNWNSILDEDARVGIREGHGYTFIRNVYFGRPGFDLALSTTASSAENRFVEGASGGIVLAANPYVFGWNYQSFGIWNVDMASTTILHPVTFGAPSVAAALPATGSARFNGVLGGLYISPAGQGSLASANLRVDVDFGARTLGFASTATTLTRDVSASSIAMAPNLDLTGTLRYDAGSASFNGTLVSAGGTMSGRSGGRFYGPAAEELGGAFQLHATSGLETFTGAYGAKR